MSLDNLLGEPEDLEEKPIVVVRVASNYYCDRRGLKVTRCLNILRKKSKGFDFLTEDCAMGGADLVARKIINLQSVMDGIYRLMIVNVKKDWETGYVDDYDYELVPYVDPQ